MPPGGVSRCTSSAKTSLADEDATKDVFADDVQRLTPLGAIRPHERAFTNDRGRRHDINLARGRYRRTLTRRPVSPERWLSRARVTRADSCLVISGSEASPRCVSTAPTIRSSRY